MSWTDKFRRSENVDDRRPDAPKPAPIKTASKAVGVAFLGGLLGFCAAPTPEPDIKATLDSVRAFVDPVLGEIEDRWKDVLGPEFRAPKLTLYVRTTSTKGCKTARSAYGPFYCPDDEGIYLDMSFFAELKTKACKTSGEACEVARAYVIAHEWGHHAQKVLGIFERIKRLGIPEEGASGASVRVELQADCFAGIWLGRTNQKWKNIKPEFLIAAQQAAQFGGDGPYGPPSHGTSAQRAEWMMKGYKGKELTSCDTFAGL